MQHLARALVACLALAALLPSPVSGANYAMEDQALAAYFKTRTEALQARWAGQFTTREEWESAQPQLREELLDMLGLNPLPERTDLQAKVTGRVDRESYTVENLHFQSLPGLYVTGNLYVPKERDGKLPAILYVCGHAQVKTNGVSYGNKTAYEHHASWFARHGYVCLVIDTVQLGELEGLHHGTYREGMWWWNSRGYTPAGVEAWNSMRAIDYLQSRPEVDGEKIGMTGRSGGGAYTWYTAAIDERVKVAAPIAGITDMHNHVVDGVVEGHCDCMYMVNSREWDFWLVAALLAPRPLLIGNTDKDTIFPLDGVQRIHKEVARIYKLVGATDKLGLLITEGGHKDTQDLQVPVFRWFNRWLKESDPRITVAATREITPPELKALTSTPSEQITTRIHESFIATAQAPRIRTPEDWKRFHDVAMQRLTSEVFRGWPTLPPVDTNVHGPGRPFQIDSDHGLKISLIESGNDASGGDGAVALRVLSADAPLPSDASDFKGTIVQTRAGHEQSKDRNEVQVKRRYMLLGTTVDSMRVLDIRQAIRRAARNGKSVNLHAEGVMAVNALYASLFEPAVTGLTLKSLPASHQKGPDYLNVMRALNIPQAVTLALKDKKVTLQGGDTTAWDFARETAALIGKSENLIIEP